MAFKIILKNSSTASQTPTSLDVGELAVNAADELLFYKNSSGTVKTTPLQAAPLASPALTGTPTAPTATAGTNTTQLATTEFVTTAVSGANTYKTITDGTTTANASGGDTVKFRAGTGLAVAVGSNDVTHGDNVQYTLDPELQALSAVTSAADALPYFTGSGTASTTTLTSTARTLLDDTSTSAMRTTLGLAIGTDVQAQDATLQSLSSLGTAADKIAYTTAVDTWAETPLTSTARGLLDDTSTSAMRTTLGLAIGTDVQPYDATLASIAALGTAADKYAYTTAIDTWAEGTITATGRSLISQTSTANARANLGLAIGTDVQAYDATLGALAAYNTTGILTQTAADTFTGRTISAGVGINISNGDGVSGNPTVALSHLGLQSLTDPNADRLFYWNDTTNTSAWATVGSGLTFSGGTLSVTGGGSMVYPSAGIANSTGSAWGTSYSTSGTGSTVALATSPTLTSSTLAAGTASANTAPIKFTSGTNLTTPEAGVIEYDGTIFSATPNTSFKRAAVPLTVYTSGVGTSGITLNTNYPLFPSANDSITLPVGTYWIRVRIIVSVTGSTVGSVLNFSAKGDGTAVGTLSFDGIGVILTTTSGSPAPQFNTAANTPTNYFYAATALTSTLTIAPSSSNNPRNYIASGQGILKITTAGTIIPAYQFAATLTSGTTTLYADNHMVLQQLDTQSAAAFGPSGCGWG